MADRPNPAAAELAGSTLMLITPCCTTRVSVDNTTEVTQPRQVTCPLCALQWTAVIREDVWHWLSVSWSPGQAQP